MSEKNYDPGAIDRYIGAFLILLAALVFGFAYQFPPTRFEVVGPGFLPQLMSVFLGILGLLLILEARSAKKKGVASKLENATPIPEHAGGKGLSWSRPSKSSPFGIILLLLLGYVAILRLAGFRVATFLFLLGCMTAMSGDTKRLPRIAVLSLVLALIIHYIFQNLMGIFLPRGILFS